MITALPDVATRKNFELKFKVQLFDVDVNMMDDAILVSLRVRYPRFDVSVDEGEDT